MEGITRSLLDLADLSSALKDDPAIQRKKPYLKCCNGLTGKLCFFLKKSYISFLV